MKTGRKFIERQNAQFAKQHEVIDPTFVMLKALLRANTLRDEYERVGTIADVLGDGEFVNEYEGVWTDTRVFKIRVHGQVYYLHTCWTDNEPWWHIERRDIVAEWQAEDAEFAAQRAAWKYDAYLVAED